MKYPSTELLDDPIISIKIDQPPVPPLSAWDHQERAWAKMDESFIHKHKKAGIVVVPTGGGKTWLASHWLLEKHIAKGGRLLWLTHRTSLLRQAFKTFKENAFLAHPLEKLNLIRISSGEAKWSQVRDQDHIVFSTIQSATSPGSYSFVIQMLDDSPKGLFVVVDEAHHASARSYLNLIRDLQITRAPLPGAKLLGLTATPLRMNEEDQKLLWDVFDHNLIYQIRMAELIEKNILS
ncbi:MAG: DEAD/DEAH box helicase family protein, partial [bacterium]